MPTCAGRGLAPLERHQIEKSFQSLAARSPAPSPPPRRPPSDLGTGERARQRPGLPRTHLADKANALTCAPTSAPATCTNRSASRLGGY